jgi:hypothetical protein
VPDRNMMVRFINDHRVLGMSGTGKLASATASGILPDLNVSTMLASTCLTFSFMIKSPFFWLETAKALLKSKRAFV